MLRKEDKLTRPKKRERCNKLIAIIAVALFMTFALFGISGCASSGNNSFRDPDLGNGWEVADSLELEYAENFSVDYFDGGYKLICILNSGRYLVVPEGSNVPDGISDDIVVLNEPIEDIYLVASDSMCLFDALDAIDTVSISGVKQDDCSVDSFEKAMEKGTIVYGGKYNEPDYELIISKGCNLAIESTMIEHNPEVREKLQELGINVITEHSSYESNPLGRCEWVKLYGALLNKEEIADQVFSEQAGLVDALDDEEPSGKVVAFFYISTNGSAVVRKSGDYVATMIEMAGGQYVFSDLGDSETATSSVTMEMEDFYVSAKDADIIIYNSTIIGGVSSIDELISKNSLLTKFEAVKNDNVWCTDQNMYQQMMSTGEIISEMHKIFSDSYNDEMKYFYKLK